ncbi:hypothetical protein [Ferruginibacter sp.]
MKTYCLTAAFVFIASLAMAQNSGAPFYKKLQPSFKALGIGEQPTMAQVVQPGSYKVYALPLDNMPCVAAPSQSLMPVFKTPLAKNGIPNALPAQDLFAGEDAAQLNGNNRTVVPDLLPKNK